MIIFHERLVILSCNKFKNDIDICIKSIFMHNFEQIGKKLPLA